MKDKYNSFSNSIRHVVWIGQYLPPPTNCNRPWWDSGLTGFWLRKPSIKYVCSLGFFIANRVLNAAQEMDNPFGLHMYWYEIMGYFWLKVHLPNIHEFPIEKYRLTGSFLSKVDYKVCFIESTTIVNFYETLKVRFIICLQTFFFFKRQSNCNGKFLHKKQKPTLHRK